MEEISQAVAEERSATEEGSFKLVFQNGPHRFFHRTLLGMVGQMMQQMAGINLITYVSVSPPKATDLGSNSAVQYGHLRNVGRYGP